MLHSDVWYRVLTWLERPDPLLRFGQPERKRHVCLPRASSEDITTQTRLLYIHTQTQLYQKPHSNPSVLHPWVAGRGEPLTHTHTHRSVWHWSLCPRALGSAGEEGEAGGCWVGTILSSVPCGGSTGQKNGTGVSLQHSHNRTIF